MRRLEVEEFIVKCLLSCFVIDCLGRCYIGIYFIKCVRFIYCRVNYYNNSDVSFNFEFFSLCGDINFNFGFIVGKNISKCFVCGCVVVKN